VGGKVSFGGHYYQRNIHHFLAKRLKNTFGFQKTLSNPASAAQGRCFLW